MKTIQRLLICLTLSLSACTTYDDIAGAPAGYVVTEFAPDGSVKQKWTVTSYQESGPPPKVKFRDANGRTVTLRGSFLVEDR